MPYTIKHRAGARRELEECRETYVEFAAGVDSLVRKLAEASERAEVALSVDLTALFEGAIEAATSSDRGSWKHSLNRWLDAQAVEKARALLTTLKKRCPPWEVRVFNATIPFLGLRPWEIEIYYEIEHGQRRFVVTKYAGLPGQLQ